MRTVAWAAVQSSSVKSGLAQGATAGSVAVIRVDHHVGVGDGAAAGVAGSV